MAKSIFSPKFNDVLGENRVCWENLPESGDKLAVLFTFPIFFVSWGDFWFLLLEKNMKVKELVEKLNLKVFTEKGDLEKEISGGYTGDLLSDVMGTAKDGNVLVTVQSHKNVTAIASLKELAAVVLVKGISPEPDMLESAEDEGIAVLGTKENAFTISGKIYELIK